VLKLQKNCLMIGVGLMLALWGLSVMAEPLDISSRHEKNIASYIDYYEDRSSILELDDITGVYREGLFSDTGSLLNFGIGSNPVWLRFEIINHKKEPFTKRLSLQTSWLDSLDFYFLSGDDTIETHHAGDRYRFSEKHYKNRYFIFDYDYPPGVTTVFIRSESLDPMLLPIYLESVQQAEGAQTFENYTYGFLYGGVIALLTYNLMLFFSLKNTRYLYYSVYLTAFLATNLAYTGHGFMWFWPESPRFQAWVIPILMMVYSVSGLAFAARFLNTKNTLPRLHYIVVFVCTGFILAELAAVVSDKRVSALLLSFSLMLVFSVAMVVLGLVALLKGNKSAKYFLFGSITHVSASAVTTMTVWGFMPFTILSYRAIEVGMMADAILLAMALADKFRIVQDERVRAEALSKIDPLTELNNRRAFYELVNPTWDTGLRKQRPMSILILDIDKFKKINDTYGHLEGDKALVQVAKILKEEIRPGDVLARWGGEEFVVFLPETRWEGASLMADRLREKITGSVSFDETVALAMTVSIGVAENDKENISLDKLISAADAYLFKAKEAGRDQVSGGLFSGI